MSSGAIPTFRISADDAARNVALATRKQRTQRRLPAPAVSIAQFAQEHQIYIFNVGPWEHKVMLGSWGEYTVPACPKGKLYASGTPIPGIYHEPIPVNESNFQLEGIEGTYVADQILGVGRNLSWNTSLVKLGVFRSSNPEPNAEELDLARAQLHGEFIRLFEEADDAYSKGSEAFRDVMGKDGSKHKFAARELGHADVKWMQSANIGKNVACQFCGTFVSPNVIKCPQCQEILDVEAYARAHASQKQHIAEMAESGEIKRGPGRPPNPKPVI